MAEQFDVAIKKQQQQKDVILSWWDNVNNIGTWISFAFDDVIVFILPSDWTVT